MSEAVRFLSLLGQSSKDALYSVNNIREDLAKAWADGKHNVVKRKLQHGESHTFAEEVEYSTAARGVTVERAINYFIDCLQYMQALSKALDTAPDAESAKQLFDGWDVDLERYWDFVRALENKMKEQNIKYYIGLQFKQLFEAHIKAFEEAGEKIVVQAGPLLDPKELVQKPKPPGYNRFAPDPYYRTQEKLREWTDRTKPKLKAGFDAC